MSYSISLRSWEWSGTPQNLQCRGWVSSLLVDSSSSRCLKVVLLWKREKSYLYVMREWDCESTTHRCNHNCFNPRKETLHEWHHAGLHFVPFRACNRKVNSFTGRTRTTPSLPIESYQAASWNIWATIELVLFSSGTPPGHPQDEALPKISMCSRSKKTLCAGRYY